MIVPKWGWRDNAIVSELKEGNSLGLILYFVMASSVL